MGGKTRISQRAKVLLSVDYSNLSYTDKQFIHDMFALVEKQQKAMHEVQSELNSVYKELQRVVLMTVETNRNERIGSLNE